MYFLLKEARKQLTHSYKVVCVPVMRVVLCLGTIMCLLHVSFESLCVCVHLCNCVYVCSEDHVVSIYVHIQECIHI